MRISTVLFLLLLLSIAALARDVTLSGPSAIKLGEAVSYSYYVRYLPSLADTPCTDSTVGSIWFVIWDGTNAAFKQRIGGGGVSAGGGELKGSVSVNLVYPYYRSTFKAQLECADFEGYRLGAFRDSPLKSISVIYYKTAAVSGGAGAACSTTLKCPQSTDVCIAGYPDRGYCAPSGARERVGSISVSPASLAFTTGSAGLLTATCKTAGGAAFSSCPGLTWTSKDPTIIKVDASGNYQILKQGYTSITASSDGKTASVEVEPAPGVPITLVITPASTTIYKGSKVQLRVTCLDSEGKTASCGYSGNPMTFKSSNPSVATVDSSGTVTGVNAGSTVITASLVIGVGQVITKTATIGVAVTGGGGGGGGGGGYKGPKLLFKVGDSDVALEEIIGVAALVFVLLLVVYNFVLGGRLGEAPRRRRK
jgi:hypothetical protein